MVASISSVPTTVVLVVSSQLAASRAPHVPPPGVVVSAHEVWLLDVEDVSPVVVASRSSLAGGAGEHRHTLAERADPPPRVFALVCSPSSRPCPRIVHGRCESHHPQRPDRARADAGRLAPAQCNRVPSADIGSVFTTNYDEPCIEPPRDRAAPAPWLPEEEIRAIIASWLRLLLGFVQRCSLSEPPVAPAAVRPTRAPPRA